jgi:hypothetical protein
LQRKAIQPACYAVELRQGLQIDLISPKRPPGEGFGPKLERYASPSWRSISLVGSDDAVYERSKGVLSGPK